MFGIQNADPFRKVLVTMRNPVTGFVTRAIVESWQAEQLIELVCEWNARTEITVASIPTSGAPMTFDGSAIH